MIALLALGLCQAPDDHFTAARFREQAAYLASDELKGRATGTPGLAAAADYVAGRFRALGLEPLGDDGSYFQDFDWPGDGRARNVLGILPGRGTLADEVVIVTAHHDHMGERPDDADPDGDAIFNGADDNASGVAALLLIAEAEVAASGRDPAGPRRAIMFACFDGEESGLIGAANYAEHPARPLERTVAVLNFDMVGRLRGRKLYATDAESSPELAGAVREAGQTLGLPVETRIGGGARSDHAVFIDRGIPGIQFLTGIHSDYHRPGDEIEAVDAEGGARIARLGAKVTEFAATDPGPLTFRRIDPSFDVGHALGLIARLGVFPELNTQGGEAAEIRFVVPLSPAAKAGLRSGDEVVAIDGRRFERVEDAMLIFSDLRLDRGLRLTARRGDRDVEIFVPPEVFAGFAGPAVRPVGDSYEVTFRYKPPEGTKSVAVVGTFNDWDKAASPLAGPEADGYYAATLPLDAGTYEYKYVMDGEVWRSDPENLHQVGRHGNSLLRVGGREEPEGSH